ncbi:MAG TPA: hypothetical protein VGH99_21510 [Pseudonocardia sp.]|jgi:hypothetical protein
MNSFEVTLREQVEESRARLESAVRHDESAEVHRHSARLADLLDRASSHGFDTTKWLDPSALAQVRDAT